MFVPDDQRVPEGLPALMSFPRTGSHWLRMTLELYFDRPMLTRHFFEHSSDRMLLVHDHDMGLCEEPSGPVIYLYRGPVDVVFSQLTYEHGETAVDCTLDQVREVADHYRRHLRRWLLGEGRSERKPEVSLAYEWMLDRPMEAIRPVIEILLDEGDRFEEERLASAWQQVTPTVVREKTEYIMSVIDRAANKDLRRSLFRYRHGAAVLELFAADSALLEVLDPGLLR